MRYVDRIIACVLSWPRVTTTIIALWLTFCLFQVPKIEVIDNVDYFHIEGLESTVQYDQLKDEFGNDEFFVVLIEGKDLLSSAVRGTVSKITTALESLSGIRKVRSISNIEEIQGEAESFIVAPLLPKGELDEARLQHIKRQLRENPLYQNTVGSLSLDALAIIAWTDDIPHKPGFRKALLQEVDGIIADHNSSVPELRFRVSGWTVTNVALSKYSREDLERFVPITYLVMLLIISLIFRSARYTFLALAGISTSFITMMALFPLLDIPVTNLSSAALPVILCLAIADCVHIFNYLRNQNYDGAKSRFQNVYGVMREAVTPCLMTSITTGIGFLSFCGNELAPMAEFGLLAACGMMVEVIATFTVLPSIILISRCPERYFGGVDQSAIHQYPFLNKLAHVTRRRARTIVIIGAMFLVFFSALIPRIEANSNIVDYLDSSLPERKDIDVVENKLGGLQTFDILLKGESSQLFKDPENLMVLESVQALIEKRAEISKVSSFVPFIKEMNKAFHSGDERYYTLPRSAGQVAQYLLLYDSNETEDLVSANYQNARLSVRTTLKETSKQKLLIDQLSLEIRPLIPPQMTFVITGRTIDQIAVSNSIVHGQVQSLLTALFFVALFLCVSLKSVPLGLFSLLPNIVPVAGCFAAMVVFDIPLDTGTSLIASIVLGIAVDDTIHFLSNLQKRLKAGVELELALSQAFAFKSLAICATSLIISTGFLILCFGSFVPTQRFGVLTALVMLLAPLADLILLPALLVCFPWVAVKRRELQK